MSTLDSTLVTNLDDWWLFGKPKPPISPQTTSPTTTPLHQSPSAPNLQTPRRGRHKNERSGNPRPPPFFPLVESIGRAKPLVKHRSKSADVPRHPFTSKATVLDTKQHESMLLTPPPPLSQPSAQPASSRATKFEERRKAWRARVEAAISAPRLYTVPLPPPPPPTTTATTPHPPLPQQQQQQQQQQQHVPTIINPKISFWSGCAADYAPTDFNALSIDQLLCFLKQANANLDGDGSTTAPVPTRISTPTRTKEELVELAKRYRSAWEVERIVVGCTRPEDILRVPPSPSAQYDVTTLRAAFKKVAMTIHPDKCRGVGEGASVAMAITKDALELLMLRSGGERGGGDALSNSQNDEKQKQQAHVQTQAQAQEKQQQQQVKKVRVTLKAVASAKKLPVS